MDVRCDCGGQQHRPQWVVIQSEDEKTGTLVSHNIKHTRKRLIMTEQYLREQIMKGNGHLVDIHRHKLS